MQDTFGPISTTNDDVNNGKENFKYVQSSIDAQLKEELQNLSKLGKGIVEDLLS